eukprot:284819790_6
MQRSIRGHPSLTGSTRTAYECLAGFCLHQSGMVGGILQLPLLIARVSLLGHPGTGCHSVVKIDVRVPRNACVYVQLASVSPREKVSPSRQCGVCTLALPDLGHIEFCPCKKGHLIGDIFSDPFGVLAPAARDIGNHICLPLLILERIGKRTKTEFPMLQSPSCGLLPGKGLMIRPHHEGPAQPMTECFTSLNSQGFQFAHRVINFMVPQAARVLAWVFSFRGSVLDKHRPPLPARIHFEDKWVMRPRVLQNGRGYLVLQDTECFPLVVPPRPCGFQ